MKELIKYLLIGIIQGISEVLPISSSAHLILVQKILKMSNSNLTLEVFLHFASLVAVVFYLRKRLIKLILGFLKYLLLNKKEYKLEFKLCWYIVISTIPIVIFTLIFKEQINMISNNILIISLLLIINGIFLLTLTRLKGTKDLSKMNFIDAFVIGLSQCLGVFPGISRSGSCLYGANIRKLENKTATDYAFLLFIPTVIGAMVLEMKNFSQIIVDNQIWIYVSTFIVTSLVTYFSFQVLLKLIKKGKMKYFGYYCILVGVINVLLSC